MPSTRKCIIPGCDHLQNSSVSLLNKLQRKTVERDGSFPASGRGFSAASGYAPSVWEHRILLIFSRFWYLILFTWRVFLALKFGWVVNNTFFCGVTNSEHTFIDFTRTLIYHPRTRQWLQFPNYSNIITRDYIDTTLNIISNHSVRHPRFNTRLWI